jgi:hypothetical protein
MGHRYYSQRAGLSPHPNGLPFKEVLDLFLRVFGQLCEDSFFAEALGTICVDAGYVEGTVRDIDLDLFLATRKKDLWPPKHEAEHYTEDDLFDVVEYLFHRVSKPLTGTYHEYNNCGMHWSTFNRSAGEKIYRDRINAVLSHYERRFELSVDGEVLLKADRGFDQIFDAGLPTKGQSVLGRLNAAILKFRRHGASLDDRRQAVRDLADVLEYLRPKMRRAITDKDEGDLFNIANNFDIRHHNDKQKTGYDGAIWLSWMFYFYLATIHVVVRKLNSPEAQPSSSA